MADLYSESPAAAAPLPAASQALLHPQAPWLAASGSGSGFGHHANGVAPDPAAPSQRVDPQTGLPLWASIPADSDAQPQWPHPGGFGGYPPYAHAAGYSNTGFEAAAPRKGAPHDAFVGWSGYAPQSRLQGMAPMQGYPDGDAAPQFYWPGGAMAGRSGLPLGAMYYPSGYGQQLPPPHTAMQQLTTTVAAAAARAAAAAVTRQISLGPRGDAPGGAPAALAPGQQWPTAPGGMQGGPGAAPGWGQPATSGEVAGVDVAGDALLRRSGDHALYPGAPAPHWRTQGPPVAAPDARVPVGGAQYGDAAAGGCQGFADRGEHAPRPEGFYTVPRGSPLSMQEANLVEGMLLYSHLVGAEGRSLMAMSLNAIASQYERRQASNCSSPNANVDTKPSWADLAATAAAGDAHHHPRGGAAAVPVHRDSSADTPSDPKLSSVAPGWENAAQFAQLGAPDVDTKPNVHGTPRDWRGLGADDAMPASNGGSQAGGTETLPAFDSLERGEAGFARMMEGIQRSAVQQNAVGGGGVSPPITGGMHPAWLPSGHQHRGTSSDGGWPSQWGMHGHHGDHFGAAGHERHLMPPAGGFYGGPGEQFWPAAAHNHYPQEAWGYGALYPGSHGVGRPMWNGGGQIGYSDVRTQPPSAGRANFGAASAPALVADPGRRQSDATPTLEHPASAALAPIPLPDWSRDGLGAGGPGPQWGAAQQAHPPLARGEDVSAAKLLQMSLGAKAHGSAWIHPQSSPPGASPQIATDAADAAGNAAQRPSGFEAPDAAAGLALDRSGRRASSPMRLHPAHDDTAHLKRKRASHPSQSKHDGSMPRRPSSGGLLWAARDQGGASAATGGVEPGGKLSEPAAERSSAGGVPREAAVSNGFESSAFLNLLDSGNGDDELDLNLQGGPEGLGLDNAYVDALLLGTWAGDEEMAAAVGEEGGLTAEGAPVAKGAGGETRRGGNRWMAQQLLNILNVEERTSASARSHHSAGNDE